MEFTHWLRLTSILALMAALGQDLRAAEEESWRFDFDEVRQLLLQQLPDLTEEQLRDAAARGLIRELEPRVRLILSEGTTADTNWVDGQLTTQFKIYEPDFGYVRLPEIGQASAKGTLESLRSFVGTNQLKGLVLDLRFARGNSYADAAQLADAFFEKEQALMDWGDGKAASTAKTNAIDLPVAVLVNHDTSASAEALAAVLREGGVGLLIGSTTAGEASMYREFTLGTGPRLRIATDPVKVGENIPLSPEGVSPDITVEVPRPREQLWMKDPYGLAMQASEALAENDTASSTARSRRHLNEADLVRMLRDGEVPELGLPPSPEIREETEPVIRDPALARALDFLKGLELVRKFRLN